MDKTFKISKIIGAPQFDSMQVAKVTKYPLELNDYKPFSQNIICVSDDALILRMWAFEVSPLDSSKLRAVLYIFPQDKSKAICIDVFSNGNVIVQLLIDGLEQVENEILSNSNYTTKPFNGEDLQGVYWGSTVVIPFTSIEKLSLGFSLGQADVFGGNFYKLCLHKPFVHSGSCFVADFNKNPYTIDSMGNIEIVAY